MALVWLDRGPDMVREITADTEASGRTVRASKDEPKYEVRSEKSGRTAVQTPGALTKKD